MKIIQVKTLVMEQRLMNLLLIQLKVMALVSVAAMVIFLIVAFSPAKHAVENTCKKTACVKEKEYSEDVRENFLLGQIFSYATLETE